MTRNLTNLLASLLVIFISLTAGANENAIVSGFRTSDKDNTTRFVLDISQRPDYQISNLHHSITIHLKNARWGDFTDIPGANLRINTVRYSAPSENDLEITLDLNVAVKITKHFILAPKEKNHYRLVIDMEKDPSVQEKPAANNFIPIPKLKQLKQPIIVIDAGHGGHDPGTTGLKGTFEKNITLAYALQLKDSLEESGNYNVILTRGDDTYIDLKKRVEIARNAKANMFISIHADAHPNNQMKGLSIYTLSEKASDKEAEKLAQKENKAGLFDNVDVEDDNKEVAELLIDLVQRETKNLSADFAENTINEMRPTVELLYNNPHRFAGFRVLTAPDIPSILIELGYLSNKSEESLLLSQNHKKKLAETIVRSIDSYFKKYPVD